MSSDGGPLSERLLLRVLDDVASLSDKFARFAERATTEREQDRRELEELRVDINKLESDLAALRTAEAERGFARGMRAAFRSSAFRVIAAATSIGGAVLAWLKWTRGE